MHNAMPARQIILNGVHLTALEQIAWEVANTKLVRLTEATS